MKIKTLKALNLLLLFLVFSACKNEQKDKNNGSEEPQDSVELKHATNFSISDFGDYYILKI